MSKAEFIVEDLLSKIYQKKSKPSQKFFQKEISRKNMKYREILLEKR